MLQWHDCAHGNVYNKTISCLSNHNSVYEWCKPTYVGASNVYCSNVSDCTSDFIRTLCWSMVLSLYAQDSNPPSLRLTTPRWPTRGAQVNLLFTRRGRKVRKWQLCQSETTRDTLHRVPYRALWFSIVRIGFRKIWTIIKNDKIY